MTNLETDFYKYVDSFKIKDNIGSTLIFGSMDVNASFTIIIPTYKRTDYLEEAINSAINQDCDFNYNIIVGDNNPDRGCPTEKMMEKFKNQRNFSYYKHSENLGMAGNWNRLLQLAQTRWVVMLHDDDVLYPYFLSRCADLLKDLRDVGIIKPKEDSTYNPIEHIKGKVRRLIDLDFYYGNQCGTPSGMLFNREKFLASGGYNQDFYPSLDYCFNMRFASLHNFYFYTEPLMYYRISVNESVKVSVQQQWLKDASYMIRQILKKYKIPTFVIDRFVAHRTIRCHQYQESVFRTKYDFDLSEVNLKPIGEIEGKVLHAYIKLFILYYKITHRNV